MPNILTDLPDARPAERFTELLARPGVRIEQIVSHGQVTPADAPMVQASDEWVVLLAGAARVRLADAAEIALAPGDTLWIPRDTPHWVTYTDPAAPSLWLAVHLD